MRPYWFLFFIDNNRVKNIHIDKFRSIEEYRLLTFNKKHMTKKYNNFDLDTLNKMFTTSIFYNIKNPNIRYLFFDIFNLSPLSRKQIILFLTKFKTQNQYIGYLYRQIVRIAYANGIPNSVLDYYVTCKLNYCDALKTKHTITISKHKKELNNSSELLLNTTLEILIKNKSRKNKLSKIIDNLSV